MRELFILLSPVLWSIKNNFIRFNKAFYKKTLFYTISSIIFISLVTKLLSAGMIKLQSLSPQVFNVLIIKGYSLVFIILFFTQIINGFIMSLDRFYQSKELEVLFTSPVSRASLFFSRLIETHLKTSWMLVIFGIPLLVSVGLLFHANSIYYIYSLVLFTVFSTVPVNIGIGITIMLSGIFHIKKIKRFMFSAGIVTIVIIVTLLRLFKPEKFVNPELFANLKLFLVELKTPSFILLPNRWLSESLFKYLNNEFKDILIFIFLLFLTSYISVISLLWIYKKYHYRGWSLLQGGSIISKDKRFGHHSFNLIGARPVKLFFDTQGITLLWKDLIYQIKDIKNIHQHLILLSLIIIYLFSIASLPLNWEEYAIKLKYIISFFNIGLILVIIASLCSKLVYPAIVSEGNSLWIIKTSPITTKKYIWTKFFSLLIPIFMLGQMLTIFSSFFINVEMALFVLMVLTTSLLSLSLVGMAINFGVSDLRNTIKNEEEEIKTGNTIYMIISVFFILFILVLELFLIYLYFLKESANIEFTQRAWLIIGGAVSVLISVNILLTFISIHFSIKRFEDIQLF